MVFSFPVPLEALDLKLVISLFNLSFSCFNKAMVFSCPPFDFFIEDFSISKILSLRTSISLSLSLKRLWSLFQSFPDPWKSPMILTGSSSLTTNPELIHYPKSVKSLEKVDEPENTLFPSTVSYKVLTVL